MTTPRPNPKDLEIWERIFNDVPDEWRTAPPSRAMLACREWFEESKVRTILDLGCGVGRWTVWLAQQGFQPAGSDFAANAIDYARSWVEDEGLDIEFVCAPLTEVAFPGRRFDAVVAALVLDLVSTEECVAGLEVVRASLTPGGRLFAVFNPVSSPVDADSSDNPTAGITQVTYTDAEVESLLAEAGLEIEDRRDFEARTRGFLAQLVTAG